MEVHYALVDYDNLETPGWGQGRRPGRPPNDRDHRHRADLLLALLRRYRSDHLMSKSIEMRVRLYGGWSSDVMGRPTDANTMLSAWSVRDGRFRERGTRIIVDIADRLLSRPDVPLYYTFRTYPWSLRGVQWTAETPSACADASTCLQISALRSWAKGRCPGQSGCAVAPGDLGTTRGQKMVDSMIVADMIYIGSVLDTPVTVLSVDDDMIPGLLTASQVPNRATLLRVGRRTTEPGPYDGLLVEAGISVVDTSF